MLSTSLNTSLSTHTTYLITVNSPVLYKNDYLVIITQNYVICFGLILIVYIHFYHTISRDSKEKSQRHLLNLMLNVVNIGKHLHASVFYVIFTLIYFNLFK